MRVAMVSGASGGIGHAIAVELLANGFSLSLGLRRPRDVPADLAGPAILVVPYDAQEAGAERRWADATIERFGRLDALVNCAGILSFVGFEDGDEADLDRMFSINVKGPFRLIRAALPHLRASGQGRVVNLASLSGKRVKGLNVGYQLSKHAVVALTHAVRRVGWDDGIRATAVCPGYVNTGMAAGTADLAGEDMTQPEDLARLVVGAMTLPNTAAVAELLVNCRYETML